MSLRSCQGLQHIAAIVPGLCQETATLPCLRVFVERLTMSGSNVRENAALTAANKKHIQQQRKVPAAIIQPGHCSRQACHPSLCKMDLLCGGEVEKPFQLLTHAMHTSSKQHLYLRRVARLRLRFVITTLSASGFAGIIQMFPRIETMAPMASAVLLTMSKVCSMHIAHLLSGWYTLVTKSYALAQSMLGRWCSIICLTHRCSA